MDRTGRPRTDCRKAGPLKPWMIMPRRRPRCSRWSSLAAHGLPPIALRPKPEMQSACQTVDRLLNWHIRRRISCRKAPVVGSRVETPLRLSAKSPLYADIAR